MCGIWCSIQDTTICTKKYIQEIVDNVSKLLFHRGPDNFNYNIINCVNNKTIIMIHTRLHIIGDYTPQPLNDIEKDISLIINGEIFNWKKLSKELNYTCKKSDCEILIPLYKKYVRYEHDFETFFKKINGQFSFILYDRLTNNIFTSRDHIGITPMYYGYDDTKIAFCSEMKGLTMCTNSDKISFVSTIKTFNPRTYLYENLNDINTNILNHQRYRDYYNLVTSNCDNINIIHTTIKSKLIESVKCQLQIGDVEFGVLLSGGLDSSLIASIISKNSSKKIKTFSIGISRNSTDLIASRCVAEFLGTEHYEFYFTIDEGLEILKNVIWSTETYDTTTIRASTAMYLLTKKIKTQFPNLKVLFSGELSDEMFSYLYGGNAPNITEFQNETINLVSNVHLFDCLRANKTVMSASIEVRVPFTDPEFVKYILSIPPKLKIFGKLNNYNTMEKQLLRDAFNILDENDNPYLPKNILYRKKEAFSDGISTHTGDIKHNWIDSIIQFCEKKYTIEEFHVKKNNYNYNTPQTKEQLYYREIFCKLFNKNSFTNTSEFTVKFWKPKWTGSDKYVDPSARKHIKIAFEKNEIKIPNKLYDTLNQ